MESGLQRYPDFFQNFAEKEIFSNFKLSQIVETLEIILELFINPHEKSKPFDFFIAGLKV